MNKSRFSFEVLSILVQSDSRNRRHHHHGGYDSRGRENMYNRDQSYGDKQRHYSNKDNRWVWVQVCDLSNFRYAEQAYSPRDNRPMGTYFHHPPHQNNRNPRYPSNQDNFRDVRHDHRGGYRDNRLFQDRPTQNTSHHNRSLHSRTSQDNFRKDNYSNYNQFDHESYPQQQQQRNQNNRYNYRDDSRRHAEHVSSHNRGFNVDVGDEYRENISREIGVPTDFIKCKASTKPGIKYQAKQSELRYHFYIIWYDCKSYHPTEVKDMIIREIEKLRFRVSTELIYVDDKDIEPNYKALIGFKFDHIAIKCKHVFTNPILS